MQALVDYVPIDTINAVLDRLEDPRIDRNKKYPLGEILFLTLTAAMSGLDSWRGIELFGNSRLAILKKYMPFEHGIPSHQTIGRVFSLINPAHLKPPLLHVWKKFQRSMSVKLLQWMVKVGDWLENRKEWLGLTSVGMVIANTTRQGITRSECRFYLMSFAPDAKRFADCCRGHWSIENSLHWVLDVTFTEDGSRKRKDHAPRNYALIRKFALNLLKNEKTKPFGPKYRRMCLAWEPDYLDKVLKAGGF